MKKIKELLEQNQQWSAEKKVKDPMFFDHLSKGQKTTFLRVRCSDSRITGEIYFHRHIANQLNALSHNSIVQEPWSQYELPPLDGWVNDLDGGQINPLITLTPDYKINSIFQYKKINQRRVR